ncbi:MAG: PilN family type IVB pilus formation outer membrane protein [Acidiferrobacterales bacterium]
MRIHRVAASVPLVVLLATAGCATVHQSGHLIAQANQQAAHRLKEQAPQPGTAVTFSREPYLMGSVVKLNTHPLPRFFKAPVTLVTGEPLTLTQIAGKITQITGVPSRLSYSAQTAQTISSMGLGMPYGSGIAPPTGVSGSTMPGLTSFGGSQNEITMRLSWTGTLKGLLDLVASRSGVFWRYRHGTIVFFLTETRTFRVSMLPGQNTFSASVTNDGTVGGGSSGSGTGTSASSGVAQTSQTVSSSTTFDAYQNLIQNLQTLLARLKSSQSGGGSAMMGGAQAAPSTAVFADPATGTVTVTATPPLLRAVARYIRAFNHRMTRQVLISVRVYNVSLSRSDTAGLNLQAAFNRLSGGTLTLTGATPPAPPTGSSGATLGAAVVSVPSWNGSSLIAQALATQGDVSLVTSAQVLALDDQPAPMLVGSEIGYLAASSAPTITSSSTVSGQLTPGQVTVGFSANFLPMVINHNRVLLGYSISLKQLQSLETVTSGGSSIQTPNVAMQNIFQRAMLKSGQTLVLSGFEQTGAAVNRTGTGTPSFWEAGGGVGANHSRTVLVITIGVHVL